MRYAPPEIYEIDKKIGDESIPDPAAMVWHVLKERKGAYTEGQIVDLFLIATERKNKTQKVEDMVKKAIAGLESREFLYRFGDTYMIMQNKV